MRLPSTFFFRLDCHQAAIVIGVFELFFHLPMLFVSLLCQVILSPQNVIIKDLILKEESEEKYEEFQDVTAKIRNVEVLNLIVVGLMVYAVLSRRRWLMLPWFVVTAIDIALMVMTAASLMKAVPQIIENVAIFYFLAFITLIIFFGIEIYTSMAVIRSFWEIGVSNAGTPNRQSDITVQFQPVDFNRGGLV